MPLRLVAVADEAVEAVTSPKVQQAAAEAMEKAMSEGTRTIIGGGDLRLSGWRGAPMSFDADYTAGSGVVRLPLKGGTYALADEGRKRARKKIRPKGRKRRGQRRPTLATPYGPRVSVKGSTWSGFHLTDRLAPKVLDEAEEAAVAAGLKAFAQVH
jgi:hypothetical protein